jgi:hypothetical protein
MLGNSYEGLLSKDSNVPIKVSEKISYKCSPGMSVFSANIGHLFKVLNSLYE